MPTNIGQGHILPKFRSFHATMEGRMNSPRSEARPTPHPCFVCGVTSGAGLKKAARAKRAAQVKGGKRHPEDGPPQLRLRHKWQRGIDCKRSVKTICSVTATTGSTLPRDQFWRRSFKRTFDIA